jgi:hypothetical protein
MTKREFFHLINTHISNYGYHLTTVMGNSPLPRFSYTIGLTNILGYELVFAGGIIYLKDDLMNIVDFIIKTLKSDVTVSSFKIENSGSFTLRSVDTSWSELTLLGVYDFYNTNKIKAFQIIPDKKHHTLDIPDMSKKFVLHSEPIWRYLADDWNYQVPKNSMVTTNLKVLLGEKITEVMRWEEDEWEMFVGNPSDESEKNMRIVSLGTMIGIDPSLLRSLDLDVGTGIWRDTIKLEWNKWGNSPL